MVVVVFQKISWENKTKSDSNTQFLWLCIILMEAANQVVAYISKLDLWSQQPFRWIIIYSWRPSLINIRSRSKDIEQDLFCFNETFFKYLGLTKIYVCEGSAL